MAFPRNQERTIVEAIIEVLKAAKGPLTADEAYRAIVAGSLYEFKAAEPKAVVRSQLRRHCVGLDFPTASPVKYFRQEADERYALEDEKGVRTQTPSRPLLPSSGLPEERIEAAYQEYLVQLRSDLKQRMFESHPALFERLVIELLLRMGYGGGDPTLSIHTGGPGDGGIDGIIKEDKLGLGQIYIQAKRYAPDKIIRRTDIQRFAGAMNRIRKGVFITTSTFAANAKAFADNHEKTISLIDGDMLCDLMLSHGLGVTTVKNYNLMRVDSVYFFTEEP